MGGIMRRAAWLALVLIASSEPARAQALAAGSGVESAVPTTNSESNLMMAQVSIAGAGPYRFIVDTAAERSVIDQDLARRLGLAQVGRARLMSLTSTREIAYVRLPDVSFIEGRRTTLNAFTVDGAYLGAQGVLGIDALREQRVVFDFQGQQIRFAPATSRQAPITDDDVVVRARRRLGQLILTDADVNGAPIDVIVDTGLEVSLGNAALRRLLAARNNQFQRIQLVGVTGEALDADYTRIAQLRIGGFAFEGMTIAFADNYFFDRMGLRRRPALLLGMDMLRQFRYVAVDYPNLRAQFGLPEGTPHVPQSQRRRRR